LREFIAGETFFTLQQKYGIIGLDVEAMLRAGLKAYCPLHPKFDGQKYPWSECPVCLDIYGAAVKKKLNDIRQARREKRAKK
jgi:hypothetical protein